MHSHLLKLRATLCIFLLAGTTYILSAQCEASFGFETYNGPTADLGGVSFYNYSSGAYTGYSWDFGDGTTDSQSCNSVDHFYQESGVYEVKLSIWNGDPSNCFSEFTQIVEVSFSNDPCDITDCVWPGDTNGDGVANLEDIINIGSGFGMSGPARDSISYEWNPYAAEDWAEENHAGVNYKHFDCNGDGIIGVSDIPAIQNNYVMLEDGVTYTQSGGVPISINFDADTIVITEENQHLEINAGIHFGNSSYPMENVYGVVLYLKYQKHYVVEGAPLEFNYNSNSFFGDMNAALPMALNNHDEGQLDVVLTRKNGFSITGQGRVASAKFIIDADIIDGRAENEGQMFNLGVHLVKAVDAQGNDLNISLPEEPVGVFFQNGIITNTKELLDAEQFQVFPNPATDYLQINLNESIQPEFVELYDLLGKRVRYNQMIEHAMTLDVAGVGEGIYILKVHTAEGIGTKRVLINRG